MGRGRSGLPRIAVASILFGLSSVFIRLAYDHGANVAGVLTVRAGAVLPWVGLLAVARGRAHGGVDTLAVVLALLTALGYGTYILCAEAALARATAIASIAVVSAISSTLLLAGSLASGATFPSGETGIGSLVALFCCLF